MTTPTTSTGHGADMAAEIKRLADWLGDVRVMASRERASREEVNAAASCLHAAIDEMAEALRISRQSEKEAWRYKDELEGDLRAALASCEKQGEPVADGVHTITEAQVAQLEMAAEGVEAIARKRMPQVSDAIVPVRTINDAARLAKAAHSRIRVVIDCLDLNKRAAQPADAGGPDARHVVREAVAEVYHIHHAGPNSDSYATIRLLHRGDSQWDLQVRANDKLYTAPPSGATNGEG